MCTTFCFCIYLPAFKKRATELGKLELLRKRVQERNARQLNLQRREREIQRLRARPAAERAAALATAALVTGQSIMNFATAGRPAPPSVRPAHATHSEKRIAVRPILSQSESRRERRSESSGFSVRCCVGGRSRD